MTAPTTQQPHTFRTWRHWIAHVLFHHLPEDPYPSDHPASLRRSPRDQRG